MQTDTMFSSTSGEHYTPVDIAERVRACLDGIDLDPASSAKANMTIKADRYYSDPFAYDPSDYDKNAFSGRDGLVLSWQCRTLWLNPPFSIPKRNPSGAIALNSKGEPMRQRVIDKWVSRWRATVNAHLVADGAMLLVPARTDTEWFQPLLGLPMCFVAGRLKFSDANNGAPFPTAIVYAGPMVDRFYTIFEEIGVCGIFAR